MTRLSEAVWLVRLDCLMTFFENLTKNQVGIICVWLVKMNFTTELMIVRLVAFYYLV